jgi:hypothetical protein
MPKRQQKISSGAQDGKSSTPTRSTTGPIRPSSSAGNAVPSLAGMKRKRDKEEAGRKGDRAAVKEFHELLRKTTPEDLDSDLQANDAVKDELN